MQNSNKIAVSLLECMSRCNVGVCSVHLHPFPFILLVHTTDTRRYTPLHFLTICLHLGVPP